MAAANDVTFTFIIITIIMAIIFHHHNHHHQHQQQQQQWQVTSPAYHTIINVSISSKSMQHNPRYSQKKRHEASLELQT